MAAERFEKLKDYLQNLIIKNPGEHYNLKEILSLLASFATIGGAVGILGGPVGSGIGAAAGIGAGAITILTIELINAYRLYKIRQQPEEEYLVSYTDDSDDDHLRPELAHSNNNSLELDDTDTQSSEEKTRHRLKEGLAKLTSKLGLHKHKDPFLADLTQEENILKPIKFGKH